MQFEHLESPSKGSVLADKQMSSRHPASNLNNENLADTIGHSTDDDSIIDDDNVQQMLLYELKTENSGLHDFLGLEFQIPPSQHILLHRPSGKVVKQGTVGTFVTLVKSFIGIAVLTLPYAMTHAGYIGGPVGLAILSFLAHRCMQLLLVTTRAIEKDAKDAGKISMLSFGGVGKEVCGIWGKRAVDGSIILAHGGFCIGYIIFISDNVSQVLCADTKNKICPSKNVVALFTVMFLMPFSLLTSMKTLVIPTLLANVALLGGVAWGYRSAFLTGIGQGPDFVAFNFSGFPIFFGMGVFAFEGTGMVLPIQRVMQEPDKLPQLLRYAMVLLTGLFISFGLLCYLAYGTGTASMVTNNFPESKLTSFVRLFYSLGVFFTFPIMMFPVFQLFESMKVVRKEPRKTVKRCMLRFCIVCISGLAAVSVPHFGLFVGLIGAVCGTLIGFILPAYFHLRRPGRQNEKKSLDEHKQSDKLDWALVVFGVVAGVISFIMTFKEFIQ